ncbi:MAG: SoxR reducing system RseC family protein [Clostridiales bacterium]|jgi:positive regulator of sigma E activity|nr:SoxR reducing system RseC family protein [Clostridiales bacterium]
MGEYGQITFAEDGFANVQIERTSACEGCGICEKKGGKMNIRVKNICGAAVGDYVLIELKDGIFAKAVFWAFGAEIIAFFAGLGVGFFVCGAVGADKFSELGGLITAIIFVGACYFWIHKNEHRFKKNDFVPVATRLCGSDGGVL